MKQFLPFLFLFLSFMPPTSSQAQRSSTAIERLEVSLWPDFDRPSVLVLLTGTLSAETPLPATVSLPLPDAATLNAVARISSDDVMIDDIEFTPEAGKLTFTTPDSRFRVEYYVPYITEDDQHQFTFNWTADVAVSQLEAIVQQPASAANLITEPAATAATVGQDGLTYHRLPAQVVPANQPYALTIRYTMTSPALTAATLDSAGPAAVEPAAAASSVVTNWPLLLAAAGGLLIIMALAWQVAASRNTSKIGTSKVRKPKPRASTAGRNRTTLVAQFCHACGQRAEKGDRFCRNCGTALKGR